MEKEAIAKLIEEKHSALIMWLEQQPEFGWDKGPDEKWTTGQHAIHLLQTLTLINKALSMPKFLLRLKFGKSNRAVRDYNTVVQRYEERLKDAKGKTFKGSKNMKIPDIKDKAYVLNRIQVEHKKLEYKTRHFSDKSLDSIILPHPLMGKMPIRELLMWTAHHVAHHNETLDKNY